MLTKFLIVIALLIPSMAHAQQPQPTPFEQSLSAKLLEEINANLQLRAQLLQAQAKIKELQDKAATETKPAPSSDK